MGDEMIKNELVCFFFMWNDVWAVFYVRNERILIDSKSMSKEFEGIYDQLTAIGRDWA